MEQSHCITGIKDTFVRLEKHISLVYGHASCNPATSKANSEMRLSYLKTMLYTENCETMVSIISCTTFESQFILWKNILHGSINGLKMWKRG